MGPGNRGVAEVDPQERSIAAGARRAGAALAWRYAPAVVVTGAAFALKMAMPQYFGPPYILFYPATMVAALLGGVGPGLVAAAMSSLLALLWVLPAESPVHQLDRHGLVSLAVFAAMGVVVSVVAEGYRGARARVARQALDRAVQESEARSRRDREEALRRYELLASNGHDIILFTQLDDGRVQEANAAAVTAYGYAREELLGLSLADLQAPGSSPRRPGGRASSGGSGRFEAVHRRKDGTEFPVEMSCQQAAIDGAPAQICVLRDITERRRGEEAARLAARRQAYLVDLGDALRPLSDPGEAQRRAARLLGEQLGASRVHYAEVVEEGRYGLVRADYCDGLPSVVGRHRFDDYGPVVMGEFRAGRTLIVPDVRADRRLTPQERDATSALCVAAYVIVPLFKAGRPVAVLVVHQATPRAWSPLEVELISETAERTWAAVERAHAEGALRESEARYRAIVEQAAVGVSLVDAATGRFLQVNRRFADLLGYPREELQALGWQDVTHPDDAATNAAGVERMHASGLPYRTEKRYRRKDGSLLWASLTVSPVSAPGAEATTQIAVVEDITDRKQAEQDRQESEERLRAAQAVAHVGSWAWHVQTGRLEWSDEMYRIFGIDRTAFTGELAEVVARAIHPDDQAAVSARNEAVLRGGTPVPLEYRIRHADGGVRTVWAEAGALRRDQAGRPELLTGIVLDVTERRGADAERARLEGQLQQARKMESVGRLAGGIAHDFNNMLGVILGHADMALEQVGPGSPLRADLEEIGQAARRSAALTRQLLAFARKQAISPVVLDLNATVGGMLRMLQRLLGEHIQLTWRPVTAPWPVRMDPSQIDQVLANLCVNARDAIAEAGHLTIETGNVTLDEAACQVPAEATPGDWVRLTVSDDGCGMDQETVARLFEPFFTTKEQGKGTGLGLATLYGIVKQNGGFVSVSSEPGVGTSFGIYLPRHLGGAVGPAPAEAPRRTLRGQETVLLVEDEPAILRVARRMLEGLGYQVLAAATPGEALRLAAAHPGRIDLVLTDVVMPEMNGRDLARMLLAGRPGLRRLFMSGYTADAIAHQGVLAEGLHFIQKPFTADRLAVAVRAALEAEG